MKPVIAISMGDPAGISYEIVAESLCVAGQVCRPVLFGHRKAFERQFSKVAANFPLDFCDVARAPESGRGVFVDCGAADGDIFAPGHASAVAQFNALERAVDWILTGSCGALVTAPVSKSAICTVKPGFIGHTEYLASRAGMALDGVTMVFASLEISVGLVSTHLPLIEVPRAVTPQRLDRTAMHLVQILERLKPDKKLKIGVAALNPHAGENGLLGHEEKELIEPFTEHASGKFGHTFAGPRPAETMFREAFAGRYDGVLALYHDQAMIPLKLFGVGQTVNVTVGLPFIRTSPDHGVAHEIAHRGIADSSGMKMAIEMASKLIG